MTNLSLRSHGSLSIMLAVFVLLASLVTGGTLIGAAQTRNVASSVDLAAVPLSPSTFPEPGFQLAQAGDIEFDALSASWAGDTFDDAWRPLEATWQNGHSSVHVLLSDRGDSYSEPLATLTTYVLGFDSPDAAANAGPALLEIAGYGPTKEVAGITVYADVDGLLALCAEANYLVIVQYAAAQQNSSRQNTEDWTAESTAVLVDATGERLVDAMDLAETGAESLGVANVMVSGYEAPWTLPWIYYPSTEHYRILDGEPIAYAGELDSDLGDVPPDGIDDLFVSRQQLGDEGYEHLIDVALARFDSEGEATAFALKPDGITFPPTWIFDPDYAPADPLPDGGMAERVQVDDNLRASGYRTIRQEDTTVQVVQWLASGNAVVSPEAIAWLTDAQSSCLDALPDPCVPIHQGELPAALSERYAPGPLGPKDIATTPAPDAPSADVVASEQFVWEIVMLDDGWVRTDTEIFNNSEYFEFQSGRS